MTDTVFTKVDYTLSSLVDAIDMGTIGLPDIQRPFVWKNTKVRNLFDSMYRGYPVGYLLLWENGNTDNGRAIGTDQKQRIPSLLIVDGQQRLTSLYAVVKGVPVVRENYASENIEIAFNPLSERFEVADAAVRKDRTYIPNISVIWEKDADLFDVVEKYLSALGEARDLDANIRRGVQRAFIKLQNLIQFPFTTLSLSASVDEEQVSEVFVRINSEGKKLNQADFILTMMSVFWDEGRAELERFCRLAIVPTKGSPSPFNYFIQPSPDQLLRVAVAVGFRRAKLKSVYSVLRGKDVESDGFSAERRDAQFAVLKDAQSRVLNLQYWHDYLKAISLAGFRSGKLISSQNNLLYCYALYLLGRTEFAVEEFELRRIISLWFFMSALTGRYTNSPESTMEFDLARLREVSTATGFVATLRNVCTSTFTQDFWDITLPTELATSAARSPSMFAYFASLILHDARVLFSDHKVVDLMDPSTQAKRSSLERHHIFPKAHLKRLGSTNNRDLNQIANFTVLEWGDNLKVADHPPCDYTPVLSARFDSKTIERMYYWHALPDGWTELPYAEFLKQRRELMARVIRDAYQKLAGEDIGSQTGTLSIEALVNDGEGSEIEFKSTLRTNLHTGEKDPRMELAVLKTVAAFLNSKGGTLIIGVADDGNPVGIDADGFANEDKMHLHFANLVKDRIGAAHTLYVHPRFDDYSQQRVFAVECLPSKSPVFVKDGTTERFYVRSGAATVELTGSQGQEFINRRFRN